MPQPTVRDVHVDQPLTNISVAYIQKQDKFIADKVFPIVPVAKQSDRYFVYTKADWFRDEAQERAPATESAGGGWTIDNTPTYYARIYAIHKDIDDVIRANADAPLNLDKDATEYVTSKLLLKRELIWVNTFFKTGVWGRDLIGGTDFTKWSNSAAANPIKDIMDAKFNIASKTGYEPNVLVLAPDAFAALCNCAAVLDRIKYTQRAVITEDILAGLFGVDKVLVAKAIVNTAAEGATESMDFMFKDAALLVYAAPNPSLMMPSGGYTFVWTGFLGAVQGVRIKRFRLEHLEADRIEGEMAFDMKVVAPDVGVFFSDVV